MERLLCDGFSIKDLEDFLRNAVAAKSLAELGQEVNTLYSDKKIDEKKVFIFEMYNSFLFPIMHENTKTGTPRTVDQCYNAMK